MKMIYSNKDIEYLIRTICKLNYYDRINNVRGMFIFEFTLK